MRKLDGYGTKSNASKNNPVSEKQQAILEALCYYFDDYDLGNCNNADEAYKTINKFEDRIDISKDEIYIDGYLIYNEKGITPYAHKFSDIPEEFLNDYEEYEEYYEDYDNSDMSTWDDDDWINFELEH